MVARPRDLRRGGGRLEQLCRVAGEIARLGDASATLRRILGLSVRIIGVRSAHLALVDDGEKALYGIMASGLRGGSDGRFEMDLSRAGSARRALRTRRPVVVADRPHGRSLEAPDGAGLPDGDLAFLPLLGGGSSFGLLILACRGPRSFDRGQLRLAGYCADLLSVALQNQRLLGRLAVSEGRFSSLVAHLPAIVYTCDVTPPFRTRYISPAVETLLGYSPAEWMRDPALFMKLVHPDDVEVLGAAYESSLRAGGLLSAEFRLLDRRGNIRWWRDAAILVRDPSGKPAAFHGVMVDVTASKEDVMREAYAPTILAGMRRPPEPQLPES